MKKEPVLVQYQTLRSATDELFHVLGVGMGYVIRAQEGRLIVIDGGNPEDGERFLNLLCELSDGAPQVSRWFITHPHSDHYGALLTISRDPALRSRLTIEEILFSVPERDFVDARRHAYAPMIDELEEILHLTNAVHTVPVTGNKFETDGVRAEVVTTWKDLEEVVDPNDTSTVLMIEAYGTKILILGDSYDAAAANAVKHWGDRLKCDVCQIAHHGLRGGSIELYEQADPSIWLLPSNQATMRTFRGKYPANAWVFDHARDLRVMGDGMLALPLPLR